MYQINKILIILALFFTASFCETAPIKENVAVLDLLNRGNFNKNEIGMITDRINTIISNLDIFTLVERNQIDLILKEQGFQQSGCTDQSCMVEVGQLLSVPKIISGTIGQMDNMFAVTLKLIDVETGKVIAQVSSDINSKKAELMKEHIPEVTKNLLVKAGILEKDTKKKKPLVSKPSFLIPVIAVLGGGVAAAVILSGDDDEPVESNGFDLSDFPDHSIP